MNFFKKLLLFDYLSSPFWASLVHSQLNSSFNLTRTWLDRKIVRACSSLDFFSVFWLYRSSICSFGGNTSGLVSLSTSTLIGRLGEILGGTVSIARTIEGMVSFCVSSSCWLSVIILSSESWWKFLTCLSWFYFEAKTLEHTGYTLSTGFLFFFNSTHIFKRLTRLCLYLNSTSQPFAGQL